MTAPVLRVKGRYPVVPGGPAIAPSVSMVAGGLGFDGQWGAAKVCANAAVYRRDEWEHLSDEAAYHWLRTLHSKEWKAKSARGTAVHSLAEDWAKGLEVDCPPECDPYLDALERFYADHQPTWLHCERSVVYTEPGREYGGTADGWAVLNDGRTGLLDWKTGARYPVEVVVKMAAYRFATALAVVDAEGRFIDTEPMPETDFAAAVYLHDDGTYEMLELPADRAAHAAFLALRDVWAWKQTAEAWEKATPEPTREGVAA